MYASRMFISKIKEKALMRRRRAGAHQEHSSTNILTCMYDILYVHVCYILLASFSDTCKLWLRSWTFLATQNVPLTVRPDIRYFHGVCAFSRNLGQILYVYTCAGPTHVPFDHLSLTIVAWLCLTSKHMIAWTQAPQVYHTPHTIKHLSIFVECSNTWVQQRFESKAQMEEDSSSPGFPCTCMRPTIPYTYRHARISLRAYIKVDVRMFDLCPSDDTKRCWL